MQNNTEQYDNNSKTKINSFDNFLIDNNLIFICNKLHYSTINSKFCNKFLFTNNEIKHLLKLNNTTTYLVLESFSLKNFKISENKQYIDKILNQSDCIYQEVHCLNCNSTLGRYIISTTEDKVDLIDSIIIFTSEVTVFNQIEFDMNNIYLNDYLNVEMNEISKINEQLQIYNKIQNNIDEVNRLFFKIKDYIKIKESVSETSEHLNILEKFTDYIEYTLNNIN